MIVKIDFPKDDRSRIIIGRQFIDIRFFFRQVTARVIIVKGIIGRPGTNATVDVLLALAGININKIQMGYRQRIKIFTKYAT